MSYNYTKNLWRNSPEHVNKRGVVRPKFSFSIKTGKLLDYNQPAIIFDSYKKYTSIAIEKDTHIPTPLILVIS